MPEMASLCTFGFTFASLPNLLPLALPLMTLALCVFVPLAVAAVVSMPRPFPDFAVCALIPSLPSALAIAVVVDLFGTMVLLSDMYSLVVRTVWPIAWCGGIVQCY